jgi:three-Cys-motif partner protein
MFELPRPTDDGLSIPTVGAWSRDKHHFLTRYVDAFTTAMKDKGWGGLHFVDLFAGAGIERVEEYGLDWGSPLIAAQAPYPFERLHACELDRKKVAALRKRLARYPQPTPPQVLQGDANEKVHDVVRSLPTNSLSLAFLDPYGLHLHFDTLRALSARKADLIIFFPDHLDALRNWENVYQGKPNSQLDRVLGVPWLEAMTAAPPDRWAQILTDLYVAQIKTLGYTEFEYERISLPTGRFLYKLIFCSRHKAGGLIWRNVSRRKPGGQGTFDFGR